MQATPEEDIMYLTGQGKYILLKDRVGKKSPQCDFCTKRFVFVHAGQLARYCDENDVKAYLDNVQIAGKRDDEELSDWFGEEKPETEEPCDRIVAALDANKELFYIYIGEQLNGVVELQPKDVPTPEVYSSESSFETL